MNPPIQPTLIKLVLLFSMVVNNPARVVAHGSSSSSSHQMLHQQAECRYHLDNCTDMVHPYLKNPQYMFPTSLSNVNDMCKMWSQFVDCIRRYISLCFEENRRVLFHKSVENSIDTVHAICSSRVYQNEYLNKATCFKQISMDHCGANYRQLIDTVSNPNANDEHICCAYAQFKQCVNRPLLDECGRKAKNLMDHSMSFLISRCNHYSYQVKTDCPSPPAYSKSVDNLDAVTPVSDILSNREDDNSDNGDVDPNGQNQSRDSSINFTQTDNSDNSVTDDQLIYVSEQSNQADRTTENIQGNVATEEDVNMFKVDQSGEDSDENKPKDTAGELGENEVSSTTTTSGTTVEPDLISESRAQPSMAMNNNNIDSIDASESEQEMIVYTLKPESQISVTSGSSPSIPDRSSKTIVLMMLWHSIRLATILWLIQWFHF